MKNSTKNILLFAMGLLVLSLVAMAFGPSEGVKYNGSDYAVSEYYTYAPAQDTITNTEADTLALPVNFLSNWTYGYSIVLGNLSGTTNVAAVLQHSHMLSGNTDWKTLASFTGTSGILQIEGTDVTGIRHRLILTGSGTQSSTYDIDAIFKKKE